VLIDEIIRIAAIPAVSRLPLIPYASSYDGFVAFVDGYTLGLAVAGHADPELIAFLSWLDGRLAIGATRSWFMTISRAASSAAIPPLDLAAKLAVEFRALQVARSAE